MNKHYFTLLLFCILQINLVTTSAQLYWSESFGSYTDGQNIDALNGWNYQDPTQNGYQTKTAIPLTYGDLVSDGTYFTGGSSYITAGVAIPVTGAFQDAYASDGNTLVAGYKTGGKNELWYSMLIRSDQVYDAQFGFHEKWPWYLNGSKLQVSRDNTGLWSIVVDDKAYSSGVTVARGVTALVVCKINFATDGTTLTLFVNPTLGTTPTGGVSAKSAAVQNINAIGYYLGGSPGNYRISPAAAACCLPPRWW